MPTLLTTTNFALRYPTSANNGSNFSTGIADLASDIDALLPQAVLVPATTAISATLTAGQLMVVTAGSTTQTLPASAEGATIAIFAYTGVTGAAPITILCAGSDTIIGVGCVGATGIKMGTQGSLVVLKGDGNGHWLVVAGENDTGLVAATLSTGVVTGSGGSVAQAYVQKIGNQVFLTGAIRGSGSGVVSGVSLLTMPETSMFPATAKVLNAFDTVAGAVQLTISSSGVMTSSGNLHASTSVISFDGLNFTLV